MENHWWQVALYVTERGLTTSPIPSGDRTFAADFDFLEHNLSVTTSDGVARTLPLRPRPVADFYQDYQSLLRSLDLQVKIWPVPVEVENFIRFTEDRTHPSYDADSATRLWRVLVQADRVLKRFRGRFLGKASPVHFFWGGFDLAATRFSGRPAPLHPAACPTWETGLCTRLIPRIRRCSAARSRLLREQAVHPRRDHPGCAAGAGPPHCQDLG